MYTYPHTITCIVLVNIFKSNKLSKKLGCQLMWYMKEIEMVSSKLQLYTIICRWHFIFLLELPSWYIQYIKRTYYQMTWAMLYSLLRYQSWIFLDTISIQKIQNNAPWLFNDNNEKTNYCIFIVGNVMVEWLQQQKKVTISQKVEKLFYLMVKSKAYNRIMQQNWNMNSL